MNIQDEMGALRERLAALEHEQWAHWTEYMLSRLKPLLPSPETLDQEQLAVLRSVERWL